MQDICSIAKENEWDAAVQARYELNYWPYYNAGSKVKACLEEMFIDSPQNMNKLKSSGAGHLTLSLAALSLSLTLLHK